MRVDAAQKPAAQQKQCRSDKVDQKQNIEVDHRFDMRRPLFFLGYTAPAGKFVETGELLRREFFGRFFINFQKRLANEREKRYNPTRSSFYRCKALK